MKTKEYSNGELTVVWKPDLCIHSANCVHGLPNVFDPKARPWINAEDASTQALKETIDKCPSGALSYYLNTKKQEESPASNSTVIQISPNGPLIVQGNIVLKDGQGNESLRETKTALCRCGASENKPFCDGKHKKIGFEG